MPLSSAAVQRCSGISLSTKKPFCCALTKRCASVTSDRNPSSGDCSARQWRARAYSPSAIDGVRYASGGNVSGAVDACRPVIAETHRQGERPSRRRLATKRTASPSVAVEYLLALSSVLWQSLRALRALLKLRLGCLGRQPFLL